jgi:hypothetical protein
MATKWLPSLASVQDLSSGGLTHEYDGLKVGKRVGLSVGLFVIPGVVGTDVTGILVGSPDGTTVGDPVGSSLG